MHHPGSIGWYGGRVGLPRWAGSVRRKQFAAACSNGNETTRMPKCCFAQRLPEIGIGIAIGIGE